MSWRDAARKYFPDHAPVPNVPNRPMGEVEAAIGTFGLFGTGGDAAKAISPEPVAAAGAPDEYWQTFYEERAAIREYDGGLSRPDAEAGALQDAIAHWLARNPLTPGVPEDGCMHCAGALPVDYRVAVLAGAGHAWLHPTCMQEMKEARLALAGRKVRRLLGFSEAAY